MILNNYRIRKLAVIMAYQIHGAPTQSDIMKCQDQIRLTNQSHPNLTKGRTYRLAKKLATAAHANAIANQS